MSPALGGAVRLRLGTSTGLREHSRLRLRGVTPSGFNDLTCLATAGGWPLRGVALSDVCESYRPCSPVG